MSGDCMYLPCKVDELKHSKALLDSGCMSGAVISSDLAQFMTRFPLPKPQSFRAFDGRISACTEFVRFRLTIGGSHSEMVPAHVLPGMQGKLILGDPWLRKHGAKIDFQKRTCRLDSPLCRKHCLRFSNQTSITVPAVTRHTQENPDICFISSLEFQALANATPDQVFLIDISAVKTKEDIQKALRPKAPPDFSKLPSYLSDFAPLFSPTEANKLPPHRPGLDHEINLVPGAVPPCGRQYNMSQDELDVLQKYLVENLENGYIGRSSSSAASAVLFVRKPNGGLRLCVDYRKLNEITIKDRTPMPLTKETFARFSKARYFTKVDVVSAFNKLRIAPGHEWKTAFRTRFGLFEYRVMPFGLVNAPASFLRYINQAIGVEMIDQLASPYVDDILIYSEDLETHRRKVREVFTRLWEAGLFLDLDKSEFETTIVKFLGFVIEAGKGVRIDPGRLSAVRDWVPPKSVTDVRSFLGFINYYRKFIRDLASVGKPLTDLTRSTSRFEWNPAAQYAFDELKRLVTASPSLAHFDPDKPCTLVTDASDYACGAVLKQPDTENPALLHPVAFFSSKHSPAEINYDVYDKELLGIISAFEEWRAELEASNHPVLVHCDHKNLEYFRSSKVLSRRQARWSEFLARFNFKIQYLKGERNEADALSRRAQDRITPEEKSAQMTQVVLPPTCFEPDTDPNHRSPPFNPALDCMPASNTGYNQDPRLSDLEKAIESAYISAPESDDTSTLLRLIRSETRHHPSLPLADCSEQNGKLFYYEKLWIPDCENTRRQVIEACHSTPLAGHPGINRSFDLAARTYYWPSMLKDIRRFVRNCAICQRSKPVRTRVGQLMPLPVPQQRWTDISMDYVTELPMPNSRSLFPKCTSVLIVIDRLSKERHLIPVLRLTSEHLAQVMIQHVFRSHGLPNSIVSDRGSQFTSDVWKFICKHLGIQQRLSTSFHPESDGQSERLIQDTEQKLRQLVCYSQDDWTDWLPLAEFSMNNQVSESLGFSPFFANKGFNPRMGVETYSPQQPLQRPVPTNIQEPLSDLLTDMRANLTVARETMKSSSDLHRQPSHRYQVGDMVMLSTKNLKTRRPCRKLDNRWIGPFRISKCVNSRAFELNLPANMRVHPVFYTNLLRPAPDDPMQGQRNPDETHPGPVAEREQEWEVERILNTRLSGRHRQRQWLVKWAGYANEEATWEPAASFTNASDILNEYETARESSLP